MFGPTRTNDAASLISDTTFTSFGDLVLTYYDNANNKSIINAHFDETNNVMNGKCSVILTNVNEGDSNISIKSINWTSIGTLSLNVGNLILSCFLSFKHFQKIYRRMYGK